MHRVHMLATALVPGLRQQCHKSSSARVCVRGWRRPDLLFGLFDEVFGDPCQFRPTWECPPSGRCTAKRPASQRDGRADTNHVHWTSLG